MSDTALGSIVRRVGKRREPERLGDELHASSFWLGTLTASIHGHLTKTQPKDRLAYDLNEFLESPACSDELRKMLL